MPQLEPQPSVDDILAEEQLADEQAASAAAGGGNDDDQGNGAGAGNDDDDTGAGADDDQGAGSDDDSLDDKQLKPNTPQLFEEKDLFIEVEGFVPDPDDPKKEKAVKVKVRNFEDIPEGFNYKDAREFAKFQNDYSDLKDAQKKQDDDKKAFEEGQAQEEQTRRTLFQWSQETESLRKDGRLPEVKAKQGSKDYDKDPGVVAENKVYKFIVEENTRRSKIPGAQPITSFSDALDIMEAREARKAALEAEKKGQQVRKQQSSYIGKSQGGGQQETKSAGYVRGSGMSPDDILAMEMQEGDN
jgi:hypothetical protein